MSGQTYDSFVVDGSTPDDNEVYIIDVIEYMRISTQS